MIASIAGVSIKDLVTVLFPIWPVGAEIGGVPLRSVGADHGQHHDARGRMPGARGVVAAQ